jgi:hypothetical protein
MPNTYNIADSTGQVRRLISDTDTADVHFSDAEVAFFYTEGGSSIYGGAALALRAWAGELARQEKMVRLGQWTGDKGNVLAEMMALADKYDKKYRGGKAGFKVARIDWTPTAEADREMRQTNQTEG